MVRTLEEIVQRQFRSWEQGRRSRGTETPRPCVALSRMPGAGSAELGRRLAERLGYAFFGIEIVDRIARETGLRHELIEGVDEHVRNAIDRYLVDAFRRERFTESEYLRHVVTTIASLGERGAAVILGRGSAFILRPERALRVLVTAPREVRVERYAKEHDLSREVAQQRLAAVEAERREFLLHHFRRDPDLPEHYELALNLGTLPMDTALDLVETALASRFARRADAGAQPPHAVL